MPSESLVDEQQTFRAQLLDAGVLLSTALEGCYVHSEAFEQVVAGVVAVVSARARTIDHPVSVRVPPVMARSRLLETSYLSAFPDLIGSVHSFRGSHREHAALVAAALSGGDWARDLAPIDAVLCPAACQQVYPLCGPVVPPLGQRFEVLGQCFRAEPSLDPARMQSFRMQEQVVVGTPAQALAHRDRWLSEASRVLSDLGLTTEVQLANDPFFGRLSGLLAAGQRAKDLKYEVVGRTSSASQWTALASANLHEDHFGTIFGLTTDDGVTAHTACVGFGLERVALALFAEHGMQLDLWPEHIIAMLSVSR
ncbi:MAG: aminoacyl--tRNA ligase-related protein [Lapillicoccus sp.]